MYKVRDGAPAKVQVEGVPETWDSRATGISPVAQANEPGMADPTKLKGLHPPQFYLVDLPVSGADSRLKPGMTGVARVYGKRMSLAQLGLENLRILLGRKIW